MICFAKEYGSFIFATGCCKITGAGLACRYSLWAHPKKYLVESLQDIFLEALLRNGILKHELILRSSAAG